jgi:hypothetical protein
MFNEKGYTFADLAYIDGDGQYAAGTSLLVFPIDTLNDPDWDIIAELGSNERQDYALALLHGDTVTAEAIRKDAGIK